VSPFQPQWVRPAGVSTKLGSRVSRIVQARWHCRCRATLAVARICLAAQFRAISPRLRSPGILSDRAEIHL